MFCVINQITSGTRITTYTTSIYKGANIYSMENSLYQLNALYDFHMSFVICE